MLKKSNQGKFPSRRGGWMKGGDPPSECEWLFDQPVGTDSFQVSANDCRRRLFGVGHTQENAHVPARQLPRDCSVHRDGR